MKDAAVVGRETGSKNAEAGYQAALADYLQKLRQKSGRPTLRTVVAASMDADGRARFGVGHLSDVLNGKKRPTPEMAGHMARAILDPLIERAKARQASKDPQLVAAAHQLVIELKNDIKIVIELAEKAEDHALSVRAARDPVVVDAAPQFPDGKPADGPIAPPATIATPWPSKRNLATLGIALLLLMLLGSFVMIWMGLGAFYGAIGVEAGELPLRGSDLIVPVLFAAGLTAALTIVVLCVIFTGALLAPWSDETKAATPAAALTMVVFLATLGVLALTYAGQTSEWILWAAGLAMLGNYYRLTRGQQLKDVLRGYGIGTAWFMTALLASGGVSRMLRPPMPWPIVIFIVGCLAAVGVCGWRLRNTVRQHATADTNSTAETTPIALLSQTLAEFMPTAEDFRAPRRERKALTVAIGLLLAVTITVIVPLAVYLSWLDERAAAGRAALEYGYIPAQNISLVLPTPVRPALISLRYAQRDPLNVCAQAASLLANESDGSWVLLRPINDNSATAAVVKLATTDYAIRLTTTTTAESTGTPWNTPACR